MHYYNVKLALRNLWKHKTFSLINILGLTIGLASCIIIGMYAFTELSFDKFHPEHAHIYRVNKITAEKGRQSQRNGITPGQLAPAMEKEIPEVAHAARFRPWFSDILVSHDTVRFKLKDVSFADASFLTMFNFPLLKGSNKTALAEPFTAVITETTAHKYFNNADPIGKTFTTLNNIRVTVTGVAKDIPANSSIQFPMLISWSTLTAPAIADNFSWMNNWNAQVAFTFVQLKDQADAVNAGDKISALLHEHLAEKEYQYRTYLQSLDDIHLHSNGIIYADQFHPKNNTIVYTLLTIAVFILLIACFNFINLTTAGAFGRAKETGIQKTLGATQTQLTRKFFGESFVMCICSLLLAIFLVAAFLPFFNEIANSSLNISLLYRPVIAAALAGLLLLISLIAGLYPAIFLSRFKSTDVFRNVIQAGKDNWLRKSLVISQFALSILLIIATIVVNKQMHFLSTKDLGFDKEQMLVLKLGDTNLKNKSREFINILKQYPGISSISATNTVPGQGFNGYGVIPEGYKLEDHILASVVEADASFASTYNIRLIKGRFFSSQMPTDTNSAVVINEAMARYLNWKDPIGKQFEVYEETKGKVIGVMKDFNFASLRENVQPLVIMLRDNPLCLSVKLKAGTTQASLNFLEKTWKQFEQQYPFDYVFLDEQLDRFYQSDAHLLSVLSIFAGLAICIACMGLLGLSIYTARQRTKEIGIRKVLGAGVVNIIGLISKEFLKLVAIAALIGFPIAWWAANKWLQDFAYRINISWEIFLLAGIAVMLIALITVSFHAIKAALMNPVKSLRSGE